jgi:hypothetical protein
MRIIRWAAVVVGGGVVASLTAIGPATAKSDRGEFADVRQATARYHDEAHAIADGYTRTDECVPGMGYHYVNFELFGAPLDPRKPAALLYAPHGEDGRKLIGVEYFVVDADQDPETHNSTVPAMFGQTFDGPMLGHGPGMPVHYDLHAYVWTKNPNGTLATWNPEVTCPSH